MRQLAEMLAEPMTRVAAVPGVAAVAAVAGMATVARGHPAPIPCVVHQLLMLPVHIAVYSRAYPAGAGAEVTFQSPMRP